MSESGPPPKADIPR